MVGQKKNGEIELLRFIFAVAIMLYHAFYIIGSGGLPRWSMPSGMLGVEFFFLVSGYFMAASVERMKGRQDSLIFFLRKKISNFYPELVVCFVFASILRTITCIYTGESISNIFLSFPVSLFNDLCFIKMLGLGMSPPYFSISVSWVSAIGAGWYLSSMLIGMIVLYPYLRKRGGDSYLFFFCLFLLASFSYGRSQCLGAPHDWMGFTYWGNIRAVGEMGMGASLYTFTKQGDTYCLSNRVRKLLTGIKYFLLTILIAVLFQRHREFDGIWLIMAWCMLACMLSKQCGRLSCLDHPICYFLGKFSLPLYLTHFVFCKCAKAYFPAELGTNEKIGIYVSLSVAATFLCWYAASRLRRTFADSNFFTQREISR